MRIFIFACIHNAGRSQMSAAFFNQLADPTKARGISAGTQSAFEPRLLEDDELSFDPRTLKARKLEVSAADTEIAGEVQPGSQDDQDVPPDDGLDDDGDGPVQGRFSLGE